MSSKKGGARPGAGRPVSDNPISRVPTYLYEYQHDTQEQVRYMMDTAIMAKFHKAMAQHLKDNDMVIGIQAATRLDSMAFTLHATWYDGDTCLIGFYDQYATFIFTSAADRDDYWEMFPGSERIDQGTKAWILRVPAQVASVWMKKQTVQP